MPKKSKKQNQDDVLHKTLQNIFHSNKTKHIMKGSKKQKDLQYSKIEENVFEKMRTKKFYDKFCPKNNQHGILDGEEEEVDQKEYEEFLEMRKYQNLLSMPRRPLNIKTMSAAELKYTETMHFKAWNANIEDYKMEKKTKMTPHELNIHFWCELWRVVERSDILIQVIDARNPLLFRNKDLETYVTDVDPNKKNILLINKSDYLTEEQRIMWAEYFDKENITVFFWSAVDASKSKEKIEEEEINNEDDISKEDLSEVDNEENDIEESSEDQISSENDDSDEEEEINESDDDKEYTENNVTDTVSDNNISEEEKYEESIVDSMIKVNLNDLSKKNSSNMLTIEELLDILENTEVASPIEYGKVTIGLIGFPNVGKSSTINAIYGSKKVSVSARPGRTKRFQTLYVTDKLVLCDCPGLVMPLKVESLCHVVLASVLPIDRLKDVFVAMNTVAEQFPRETLEAIYGMKMVKPKWNEDPNRQPTGLEVCQALSYSRNMRSAKGVPYVDKAARILLKDYLCGKLLYRYPPPDITPQQFKSPCDPPEHKLTKYTKREEKLVKVDKQDDLMIQFIQEDQILKGSNQKISEKPWKQKENKKNKRHVKLRRLYAHKDQHED